jgi:uncharacterized protein (DUF433 family)
MGTELIGDRGRGPEIVGTRITVYNLLTHFLDATVTEASIARLYDLTPEQVAAARAYILTHADTVLAEHLRIEERIAEGNSPAVIQQAQQTRANFQRFQEWLAQRDRAAAEVPPTAVADRTTPSRFPTFREWFAQQESKPQGGT